MASGDVTLVIIPEAGTKAVTSGVWSDLLPMIRSHLITDNQMRYPAYKKQ